MADVLGDFLFELQWWHGCRFIQRFRAYDGSSSGSSIVWDPAWPLFQLQEATKALRDAVIGRHDA